LRNAGLVGTRQSVLVDAVDAGRLSGRTPHFRIVHFDGPPSKLGRVVDVDITHGASNSLLGRAVFERDAPLIK